MWPTGGQGYRGRVSEWARPALPAQWTGTANLPPFVGRRRELAGFEAIWESVERGARQVVFVGGESGAGKSRLAAEAGTLLDAHGVSVLVGSCIAELGLPFDPFVQPVRTLLPAVDEGVLALAGGAGSLEPAQARDLLRLLTEGHTLGSGPILGARGAVVFEAVLGLLDNACAVRPLLLVLEDLHWAGESALRILRFIVERTAELPLLVIATYRNTRPDRSDPLSAVMADLMRTEGVHRVDLQGLDTDDVVDYLTAWHAGTREEVRHGAALLRDHTGGNPFVLREVWRDLAGRGGLAGLASGAVSPPDSLRAVIAARLSALPPEQRRLVSLGAVVGEDFAIGLIRAVAGAELGAAEVFAAMGAAAAAGLVEPALGRPGVMRFEHALARQAVLETMEPFELATAHAQVGFTLEEGFAGEENRVQRLAHHFSSAAGLGLDDRAVRYLEEAASIAADRLANSDAGALFERAAAHARDAGEADRLRVAAARAYHLAGRMLRAQELNEDVASQGHPSQRLSAAIGYEAASWRSGMNAERATEMLRGALGDAALMQPSSAWEMLALGALSRAMALSGRRDEAVVLHQRAVAAARQTGDERLLVAVLHKGITLQADISVGKGLERLRRQVDLAEEVSAIAKRRHELRPLGAASQMRTFAAYVLGDRPAFDAAVDDLALMVRATSQPYWRWSGYLVSMSRSMMRCEFAEAAQVLATSRRLEHTFGEGRGVGEGPASVQTFMLRRETGGLEFARRVLAERPGAANPWRPGLVALLTELGMAKPASVALREALEQDLPRLRISATWPAALSFLGEAAAWLGDREAVELLLAETEPFVGLNLMGAEFLAALGSSDRLVAVLKSALGSPGVEDHFAAALGLDERMGSPLHVATTHAEWAAHLSRTRATTARVEEHAKPARALADRHGLVRVRRILGPLALAGRASLPDGLTVREHDVLRLIGRGCSNRDIAAELVISEYTAANHVRSILMKTRCANRTAAAHYAVEHGLLGDASRDGLTRRS